MGQGRAGPARAAWKLVSSLSSERPGPLLAASLRQPGGSQHRRNLGLLRSTSQPWVGGLASKNSAGGSRVASGDTLRPPGLGSLPLEHCLDTHSRPGAAAASSEALRAPGSAHTTAAGPNPRIPAPQAFTLWSWGSHGPSLESFGHLQKGSRTSCLPPGHPNWPRSGGLAWDQS